MTICKRERRRKEKCLPGKKGKAPERRHLLLVLKEEVELTRQKAFCGDQRADIAHGRWRGKIRARLVLMSVDVMLF